MVHDEHGPICRDCPELAHRIKVCLVRGCHRDWWSPACKYGLSLINSAKAEKGEANGKSSS